MSLFVKDCTFEEIGLLNANKTFFPGNFITVLFPAIHFLLGCFFWVPNSSSEGVT